MRSRRGLVSLAGMARNLPEPDFRPTSRSSSPANSQEIPSCGRWTGTMSGVPEARVLVVDDEDSITDLVATALRYVGFEVVRRLRSDGVRVPIVFLTARDATEDKVA